MDEDYSGTAASSSSSSAAAAALSPVQQLVRDFESVQERVAAYGGVPSRDSQADLISLQNALRARQEGEACARKAEADLRRARARRSSRAKEDDTAPTTELD